ncbi:hypothetical protein CC78DRAFT_472450, partial [Lojkania enalia]
RNVPHGLAEVCSTLELPSECNIIILSSGMVGITTIYHILHDNDNILLIVVLEA